MQTGRKALAVLECMRMKLDCMNAMMVTLGYSGPEYIHLTKRQQQICFKANARGGEIALPEEWMMIIHEVILHEPLDSVECAGYCAEVLFTLRLDTCAMHLRGMQTPEVW
jgi:hypothetical protein